MSVTHDEAAQWLGRVVCIHWDGGGMEGEGHKLVDDHDQLGEWFQVDYGYAVLLSKVVSMHTPEDCDRPKELVRT